MVNERISGPEHTRNIFADGDVERALVEGRRLRAQAMRDAFSRLRPALGPNG